MAENRRKFIPDSWLSTARPRSAGRGGVSHCRTNQPVGSSSSCFHWRFGNAEPSVSKTHAFKRTTNDGSTFPSRDWPNSETSNTQQRWTSSRPTPSPSVSRCEKYRKTNLGDVYRDPVAAKGNEKNPMFFHSRNFSVSSASSSKTDGEKAIKPDTKPHDLQTEASCSHQSDLKKVDDQEKQKFQLHRKWENISTPVIKTGDHTAIKNIRVISYNILSQKLLQLNHYLYSKCNPDILPWDYRWAKLRMEIQEYDAEVLCLQEVEECHYDSDIKSFLESLQYECHYKKRTGNNKNKPDGVLIAFKKDHFKLITRRKVEYHRGKISPINQDNVGLITLLRPCFSNAKISDQSCLCIVNTHLLYNPKRGDIKLVQLSTLFAEIHHTLSGYDITKIPILICGDFNSVPKSHLFNFITSQHLNYENIDSKDVSGQHAGHKGKLHYLTKPLIPECLRITENGCVKMAAKKTDNPCRSDVANTASEEDLEGNCHLQHSLGELVSSHCHDSRQASTTQDRGVTVDYIFHTPFNGQESDLSLYPTRRLSLIPPASLSRVQGIPNAAHPSDHLPVIVDFNLVGPSVYKQARPKKACNVV